MVVTATVAAWVEWAGWICNAPRYISSVTFPSFGDLLVAIGLRRQPFWRKPESVLQKTPLRRGFLFVRPAGRIHLEV
jgi:hypothetical protein